MWGESGEPLLQSIRVPLGFRHKNSYFSAFPQQVHMLSWVTTVRAKLLQAELTTSSLNNRKRKPLPWNMKVVQIIFL